MVKVSTLVVAWLVILLVIGLAWVLAYVPMGPVLIAVELALAVVQAVLVLLYFMGLRGGRSSYTLVVFVALWFALLIIGLTTLDVATRKTFPRAPIAPRVEDRR
jgi:caa(3)-type oxidase subunit IV